MTRTRLAIGRRAEELAADHLRAAGVEILARNVRVRYRELGIAGELDLVGLDTGTLVVAEVKARRAGSRHGPERAVLAVGPRKQVRIRRLARAWLSSGPELPRFGAIRFDVVGVELDERGLLVDVEWLRGAF